MLAELGRAAREVRLAAGRTQLEIAIAAGTSHATISRLESGRSWPREPDQVVGAYERECKLSDGELWRRAIEKPPAAVRQRGA